MAGGADAYVDTSAFIAFLDRSDTWHSLFRRLFAAPPRLLTSSLVVAEGHGWFLRRYDSTKALQFLAMIDAMQPLEVVSVGPADIENGAAMLRRFQDQDLTLADAVGLQLMGDHDVRQCWSTDRHLALTGVSLAIHRG
ncbi:MAG: PIN domain-containing protein [Acidobacteria bacterium]|nr:PIN domain-containing protein [Acidobacteriota bacterium]